MRLREMPWMIVAVIAATYIPENASLVVPDKEPVDAVLSIGSTTALMCDPIFAGQSETATWYKGTEKVGDVDSKTNVYYGNRPYTSTQKIPEVGFLIVSNASRDDEGLFYCVAPSGVSGDVSHLRVSFVSPLPGEGHITLSPRRPTIGDPLVLTCSLPEAYPPPSVTWQLNGGYLRSDFSSYPNGTLVIKRFSLSDLGVYTCNISNFAGSTTTRVFVDVKHLHIQRAMPELVPTESSFFRCTPFLRGSVLWFLIGCLATSCGVLLYLLCALVCLRPGRNRVTLRPTMFLRAHPNLGPGFRKPIVPMPDVYIPPTQPLQR